MSLKPKRYICECYFCLYALYSTEHLFTAWNADNCLLLLVAAGYLRIETQSSHNVLSCELAMFFRFFSSLCVVRVNGNKGMTLNKFAILNENNKNQKRKGEIKRKKETHRERSILTHWCFAFLPINIVQRLFYQAPKITQMHSFIPGSVDSFSLSLYFYLIHFRNHSVIAMTTNFFVFVR